MNPTLFSDLPFVKRFIPHEELASTSDSARGLAALPEYGLVVIQADRQTGGRGRSGTPYFCPKGGVWATIVTPLPSLDDHFSHNRALSLAVCESIESFCGTPNTCAIKWPNDIYWGEKKLCGILLENHPADALLLGLGVNVNVTDFPPELRQIATSMRMETGTIHSRSRLLARILEKYQEHLGNTATAAHHRYTRRLYGVGRSAEIDGKRGVFDGVGEDGRLRLKTESAVEFILSGHLRLLDKMDP